MAGDGTSRINTEELLRAVQEITSIKKSIAANTDATYAIFRKLQDSYAGESADDIYAVAGQLRKSSGAIITMLGNYERVLKELAGVYEDTEKTVSRNAGRLKFGGMRERAAIHFDSQSVKKQAKLLEEAADQIQNQTVKVITAANEAVAASWSGKAAEIFVKFMQEQNTDLASGAASLREIAAVLRDACSSMEKAEAQAKAVVSRR